MKAWFLTTLLFLLFLYVLVITLINVRSVGYDPVAYNSMDYNLTHQLWYDKFVPHQPPTYSHRQCEEVTLKLNDYFVTNSDYRFFLYELVDFLDPTQAAPINGVNYSNNAFSDCYMSTLEITEYLDPVPPELKATVSSSTIRLISPLSPAMSPLARSCGCDQLRIKASMVIIFPKRQPLLAPIPETSSRVYQDHSISQT